MSKKQNLIFNKKIKEAADKNQKGYVDPDAKEEASTPQPTKLNTYGIILDKASYNRELNKTDSGLNRYYTKYPREDGIDAEGHPVRDPQTEVVGHSWESAITALTDPVQTSSFPWIDVAFDNLEGTIDFKYDGEIKDTWDIKTKNTFGIVSVPNDLNMPDYRLVWGTGAVGEKTFNPELFEIIYTPKTE